MEKIEYMSVSEAASKWNISPRRIQLLCASKRVPACKKNDGKWLLPITSNKPTDARFREIKLTTAEFENERKKILKKICENYINEFKNLMTSDQIIDSLMHILTTNLLYNITLNSEINIPEINILFPYNKKNQDSPTEKLIKNYFKLSRLYYYDDTLSWAYQYCNKILSHSKYKDTQFFTEKYMIKELISSYNLSNCSGLIFDPACGGGNFLTSVLEQLINEQNTPTHNWIIKSLECICGYEVDIKLAKIAYINLKLKAIEICIKKGISIKSIIHKIKPKIFISCDKASLGSLENHDIKSIITENRTNLDFIYGNASFIFTNPPFKTIKGMDKELSSKLKELYPMSKCDMCNSFLECIIKKIPIGTQCGIVIQNSLMYLSSFNSLKNWIYTNVQINEIIELGPNAFQDLNGEKANISLVKFTKHKTISQYKYVNLTKYGYKELSMMDKLSFKNWKIINQLHEIEHQSNPQLNLDFNTCINKAKTYNNYATAMQGTSTGDNKNSVDYFWNHLLDNNWLLVSKGGGYARWCGLSSYVVKWGKNGEFINSNKGHAFRNIRYFNQTQLVFSDTGTAGLSVRKLLPKQIFIASGPGIRIHDGDVLNHLAFLNSSTASYFIRAFTPKLSIAAGYINKLPVNNKIINSKTIKASAYKCLDLKNDFIAKRPIYSEFLHCKKNKIEQNFSLNSFILKEFENEFEKLYHEDLINQEIIKLLHLNKKNIEEMKKVTGGSIFDLPNHTLSCNIDNEISSIINCNCELSRTRFNKESMGSDGVLEYLCRKFKVNPRIMLSYIKENINFMNKTVDTYRDFILHILVLEALSYGNDVYLIQQKVDISTLTYKIKTKYPLLTINQSALEKWIVTKFNRIHNSSFLKSPCFHYQNGFIYFIKKEGII